MTAKPFLETLQRQEYGGVLDKLTEAQHEVLQGVQKTQKSGEITLKIKYAHEGAGQVSIVAEVTHKAPRMSAVKQIYYLTPEANLALNDPRQVEMDLRSVSDPSNQPLRQVG